MWTRIVSTNITEKRKQQQRPPQRRRREKKPNKKKPANKFPAGINIYGPSTHNKRDSIKTYEKIAHFTKQQSICEKNHQNNIVMTKFWAGLLRRRREEKKSRIIAIILNATAVARFIVLSSI